MAVLPVYKSDEYELYSNYKNNLHRMASVWYLIFNGMYMLSNLFYENPAYERPFEI